LPAESTLRVTETADAAGRWRDLTKAYVAAVSTRAVDQLVAAPAGSTSS
jgi:hypothetical protein